MTEDDYKKLGAGEKKGLDTILRRSTLSLLDVESVGTADPKSSGAKSIDINMKIRFNRDLTKKEMVAIQGGPELFEDSA